MTILRVTLILAAAAAAMASILDPEPIPEADTCEAPEQGAVSAVRLLDWKEDVELEGFVAQPVVVGSQGGSMVRFRMRLEGESVPSCSLIRFSIGECGDASCQSVTETQSNELPLRTYEGEGGRVTEEHYFILPGCYVDGTLARMTVQVGDREVHWPFYLAQIGQPADAGAYSCSGGLADAGPADGPAPADAGSFPDGGITSDAQPSPDAQPGR